MGPLQESLTKALPSPTQQKTTVSQSNQQSRKTTTMHWPDSSYKCFETIATPSPIPIVKSTANHSTIVCDVHRSSSLDSLANSDEQQSEENSSSWFDTNSDLSNDDDDDEPLTDCDSINEELNESRSSELCAGDKTISEKPIVTELVRKKSTNKQCDNRDCAYKQFEPNHTIDDCAPNTDPKENNENELNTDDGSTTQQTSFVLNSNQQQKIRRTSITSSGSVGRMETIIEEKCHEEPIEPKISVKEILARFETLTSLEVHKMKKFIFIHLSLLSLSSLYHSFILFG